MGRAGRDPTGIGEARLTTAVAAIAALCRPMSTTALGAARGSGWKLKFVNRPGQPQAADGGRGIVTVKRTRMF